MPRPRLHALALSTTLLLVVAAVAIWRPHPVVCFLTEDCGNCVDDDGDGLVDRKDPDCTLPADGGNVGIGNPVAGKALTKCQSGIQKAGVSYVLAKLKGMHKCLNLASSCIQLGKTNCQSKAEAGCEKVLEKVDVAGDKLEAVLGKACETNGPSLDDLKLSTGLGFGAEEIPCGGSFGSTSDVLVCIRREHSRRAERMVGISVPRATDLLVFAGQNPAVRYPDLAEVAPSNGVLSGVPASEAKALLKCEKTIQKATVTLTSTAAKAIHACVNAVTTCLQTKPNNPTCIDPKADRKCVKLVGKLVHPVTGLRTKLATQIAKGCNDPSLNVDDIGSDAGLGFNRQNFRCSLFDFLDTDLASRAQCLGVQLECEGGQIVEREAPRVREFGALIGILLPGLSFL